MEAEGRLDWNVYKQIFKDHWEGFKDKYPEYDSIYYNELVEKEFSEIFSQVCSKSADIGKKEDVPDVGMRWKSGRYGTPNMG